MDKILCKSLSCTAPPPAEFGLLEVLAEDVVLVGAAGVLILVVVAAGVEGVVELHMGKNVITKCYYNELCNK